MNGGVCARFKLGDMTMPGIWSCDSHVIPEHRSVTNWFFRLVNDNVPGVQLGIPNAAMYPFAIATGAIADVDELVELKAGLDFSAIWEARGYGRFVSSGLGLVLRAIPKVTSLVSRIHPENGISIREIPEFDSRFDTLWQMLARDYEGIMVRDYAYLAWRFDRCPNRTYRRYAAERDGRLVGYMVTREQQLAGRRRGLIVDFLVRRDDQAALHCLARRAMGDFLVRRVATVTCAISSTQREHMRLLRWHGFFFHTTRANIVAIRGPLSETIGAISNWFFTYADADTDYNEEESTQVEPSAAESLAAP
jgi:hypothetical protein